MASVTTSPLDSLKQPTPAQPPLQPTQLTFGSDSTPFSATPQQLPTRSLYEVAEEIVLVNKKFEELVETVEDSFLACGVSVVKMQRSIKHIPMSLKLELGEYFIEHSLKIFKADSIGAIFNLLSFCWDFLNPGLLGFIVGRFGSPEDISLMTAYLEELEIFRRKVKVGEFVRANNIESVACYHHFYKRIVTIMGDDWKKATLQDVEDYKIKLAGELQFQPFLTQIHVRRSSIAIVFSIPHWIQINFVELEPFFRSKNVVKVCLGDFCLMDLTKQVNNAIILRVIQRGRVAIQRVVITAC